MRRYRECGGQTRITGAIAVHRDVNTIWTNPMDESTRQTPTDTALWHLAGAECARWQRGDPAGLDALVRLLTPVLWHVVRAYGLSRSSTEDVVQSTWLALVGSQHTLSDPRSVSSWLPTTARREAWRTVTRDRRSTPTDDVGLDRSPSPQATPEARVLLDEDQRSLWDAISRLSAR